MPSVQEIRAGAAYIELYAKDNALVRGLDRAQKRLRAFGTSVREIGTKLTGLGAAALAPLAASAKTFAEMGSELVDMSQRTGASVEALSELGFAADQSGTNMETLEAGLRKMQRTLADAADGSDAAGEALAQLGLSVNDLAGLSPDAQFQRIAERIARIQDPAQKAAAAIRLFGKSGAQLLPLMAGGAAGIAALREEARRLGLTISGDDARAAEAFGDRLDLLWKVVKRGVFAVGSALEPVLSDLAQTLTRNLVTVSRWIQANKTVVVTVLKVAAAVLAGGAALVVLGSILSALATACGILSAVITGVGTAIGILGTLVAALVSPIGLVVVAIAGLSAALLSVSGVGGKVLAWLGERFQALQGTALAALRGIGDALAAGDLALAAKILWLSFKLLWQEGVAALLGSWAEFKAGFLRLGTEAFYGAALALTGAFAGIETAWLETTSFLAGAWTRFLGWLTQGWNSAVGFLQKTWARFRSLFDDTVQVETELARIDDELAQQNAEAERAMQQALAGGEQQRQDRRAAIERDRAATEAELVRQGSETVQGQNAEQAQAASRQALRDARKEWEDAIAQAGRARQAADAGSAGSQRLSTKQRLLGAQENVAAVAQRTVDVQGTFNAAAVQGLAAGGPTDRIAKATEDTAKGVNKLVRHADHGGLVFE